jgi:hypothetical protein
MPDISAVKYGDDNRITRHSFFNRMPNDKTVVRQGLRRFFDACIGEAVKFCSLPIGCKSQDALRNEAHRSRYSIDTFCSSAHTATLP